MSRKNNSANKNKPTDRTTIYVALIGLIGTIIVALVSIINTRTQVLLPASLTQAQLPTNANISAITSTAFVCGNGAIPTINTPQPIVPEPTLVVVMVDESTTKEALEVVLSSLDKSLKAGDRVIVIVSGEQAYDKATVADEKVQSIAPLLITPSPLPLPTLTPIPTPVQTLSGSFQIAYATKVAQEAFVQATQNAIEYSCSVYQWNSSYQASYSQWETESKKLVLATVDTLTQKIQNYGIIKTTNNAVFESLGLVSNIFETECSNTKYKKCVFAPIGSMTDFRVEQPPSEIHVNLNKVEVVGTFTNCSFYDQECQQKAELWTDYFGNQNVTSVQFVNLSDFGNLLVQVLH